MNKGIKGLSYLPKLDIDNQAGQKASIRAYRAVLNHVQFLQAEQIQNITLTAKVLPDSQPYFDSTWTIVSSGAFAANGTVQPFSAIAGDTFTLAGLLYTGVAGVKSNNTEFSIDTGDIATASDLAASITNDTRISNNGDFSASESFGSVTIVQSVNGLFGNDSTLESSNGTRLFLSGSTLTGGLDPIKYTLTFISENNLEIASIPPVGLTTKRPLDISFTGGANKFTVRSVISVINWIERVSEVKVSSGGLGTQATGTATFATVTAADTVTVNGLVYTAVAGVKSNNTEFSIDGSDTVDAADLADSIQKDTRIGTLADVTATSTAAVVTFSSTAVGALGNAVTLAETGTTITISGATFSGGSDQADAGEGVISNAIFNGATPYLTYTWSVVKLGDVYTLNPTAAS